MILHITGAADHAAALATGEHRGDTLASQGFVHASTGRQWLRPLRAHFAGRDDLVVLGIDEARLPASSPLRYEAATPGGDEFPHVYGPLPAAAIVAAEPVPAWLTRGWGPLPWPLAQLVASAYGREAPASLRWCHGGWTVTTDPAALDVEAALAYLAGSSYWAPGRTRDAFKAILAASRSVALLTPDGAFAGMARVVSDVATFAYVADVLVLPPFRGAGRGVFLVESVLEHPELQAVGTWMLGTRDAHGLYVRFGFEVVTDERWMRRRPAADSPAAATAGVRVGDSTGGRTPAPGVGSPS